MCQQQVIRVYSLPDGTFSSDEEEEEEEDEEDEEEEGKKMYSFSTLLIYIIQRSKRVCNRLVVFL